MGNGLSNNANKVKTKDRKDNQVNNGKHGDKRQSDGNRGGNGNGQGSQGKGKGQEKKKDDQSDNGLHKGQQDAALKIAEATTATTTKYVCITIMAIS
ncbi:MAG: hypothetical protein OEV78_07420 [Spirochaetia bacterium]|nr:hypothetical protein [Spirochaetia bacterium]